MKKFDRSKSDTLAFRTWLTSAVAAVALLLTLGLTNLYCYYLLTGNIRSGLSTSGQLFGKSIDGSLATMNSGLLELVSLAAERRDFTPQNEMERYLGQIAIKDELKARLKYIDTADAFFYYDPAADTLVNATSARIPTGSTFRWEEWLRQADYNEARRWQAVQIGSEYWLTLYYDVYGIKVGGAVRLRTLLNPLLEASADSAGYLFADSGGTVVYTSHPDVFPLGKTIAVDADILRTAQSDQMLEATATDAGSLVFYRPVSDAVLLLSPVFLLIVALDIAALVVVVLLMRRTNREITTPIGQLTDGVREVERGNWEYQLQYRSAIWDFRQLLGGFNHMVREVQNLKIEAYEAELEKQRNQLRYLQLQIRPHFYLNAITTISSLTYQDRKEDVRVFIDALGRYLRYLFSGENTEVRLQEEIDHCRNFIRLQEIKYPEKVFSMVQLDPSVQEVEVPKFLVQTLVENIFKHGFSPESFLSIFIEASPTEENGTPGTLISVEDNGCGFPEEWLRSFPQPDKPEHVGLNNLYVTLKLIYGDNSRLSLTNAEAGGARIEIFLPQKGADFPCAS